MRLCLPGDLTGHGTKLAAIAAGSADPETGFIGAAPLADIAVVKLKPAKKYVKDYFMVPEEAEAYQEDDMMLGCVFSMSLRRENAGPW